MTATLSGTLDWAPGTTYYVPDSTANLLALGEYQARGWEIKSNGRNELILTPPQPSATPLIFKRQRNNLYVWDVDISTVTMKPMEPQVLSPCSPPQPRATTVGAALKLVANRWLSKAQLEALDKIEALHWVHGHVSDNILGTALDHQVLKHGDDLSSHHVRLNRQVRGSCPGCDTGKFRELPAKASTAQATGAPGDSVHADLIPLGDKKGDYLLLAVDNYTGHGFVFYQPTKSAADCTRSMAKLVRHYRRHGHRLRLIRSDPDKPLLAAADLLEDKFRGLKMRHANPEEHERVFENFYKTIKGDTICIKEQLPYELPQRHLKYAYAYAVDRRNAMPNDKTSPLTPSILFSGTRPAADLLPFGATVMVRKGRAKRALDGQLAGKTELAVILGTLQRQSGYVVLIENGELQARAVKAIRDRTTGTPFGWKPKSAIRPVSLADSTTGSPGYMHVPAAKTADLFVPAPPPLGRLPTVIEADESDCDNEPPTDELDRLGTPSPKTPPAPIPEPQLRRVQSPDHALPAAPRVQTPKADPAPPAAPRRSPRLGTPQAVPQTAPPPAPQRVEQETPDHTAAHQPPTPVQPPRVIQEAKPIRLNKRGVPIHNPAPPTEFNPFVSTFQTEETPHYLRGSNYTEINSFSLKAAQVSASKARRSKYGDTVNAAIQHEFSKMQKLGAGPLMPKNFRVPEGTSVLPSFGFITIKKDAHARPICKDKLPPGPKWETTRPHQHRRNVQRDGSAGV